MTTVGYGRLKRLGGNRNDVSTGDASLLNETARPDETSRPPLEGETLLMRQALLLNLALKALDRAISDYCGGTGRRRPSYAALAEYLDECERERRADTPALLQPAADGQGSPDEIRALEIRV